MIPARLTKAVIRSLDCLAEKVLSGSRDPEHLRVGKSGEEDAYFYLRKLGYVMVARNFRSPRCDGEIDLIGWQGDTLCFIEVKTRTTHDVKPPEAAVDKRKQHEIALVARDYLRHIGGSCQWRFDVISVYYDGHTTRRPRFELFKNAFSMS
jgi:putative endonuclease